MNDAVEFTDSQGEKWYRYTCSYVDHNGETFCMELWALNNSDADHRAAAIRDTFKVDGRIAQISDFETGDILAQDTVPANTGTTH